MFRKLTQAAILAAIPAMMIFSFTGCQEAPATETPATVAPANDDVGVGTDKTEAVAPDLKP